jgi:hypothetical protein
MHKFCIHQHQAVRAKSPLSGLRSVYFAFGASALWACLVYAQSCRAKDLASQNFG